MEKPIKQPVWAIVRFKKNGSIDNFGLGLICYTKKEAIIKAEIFYEQDWETLKNLRFVARKLNIVSR